MINVLVVLHGSEAWILSKKDRRKITSDEIKFLRAVKSCTLTDRISNEKRKTGTADLQFGI